MVTLNFFIDTSVYLAECHFVPIQAHPRLLYLTNHLNVQRVVRVFDHYLEILLECLLSDGVKSKHEVDTGVGWDKGCGLVKANEVPFGSLDLTGGVRVL